jgi:hypothetical protein
MLKQITVLVCPTPDCPDYYGSPTVAGVNLAREFSGPKTEDRDNLKKNTGSPYRKARADCPTCLQRDNKRVTRVPVTLTVRVPEPVEPEPLPAA